MRHDGHSSGHQLGGRRNQALIFRMGLGFSLVVDRNDAHCSAPNCFGEGYDALALSALGTKGRLSAPAPEGPASSSTSKSFTIFLSRSAVSPQIVPPTLRTL